MLSMTPWNRNLRLNVPKLSQFKLLHCQKGFSSVWWVRDSTVSEECCSVARWCWLLLSAKTCREHFHPHFSPISSPTQTIYFGCTVMMFSFLIIVTIWESKSKVSKSDKHYELQWGFFHKAAYFHLKGKGFLLWISSKYKSMNAQRSVKRQKVQHKGSLMVCWNSRLLKHNVETYLISVRK